MEYKFKTVHKGKLVDCYLMKDLVFIEANLLCRYETDNVSCANLSELLKDAPVFQYIGKKDSEGEEIYCGHELIMPDETLEKDQQPKRYKVIFEEMVSGFVLENEWNQIFHCDDRVRLMKIGGHSGLMDDIELKKIKLKPVCIPGKIKPFSPKEKNENN
jgi:hypothetical protein